MLRLREGFCHRLDSLTERTEVQLTALDAHTGVISSDYMSG